MQKLKITLSYILGGIVLLGVVALAGSLTPPEGSSTDTGTMYTTSDIYNKLTSGTDAIEGEHPTSTTTTPNPEGTMFSLKQIYEAIPALLSLSDSTTTIPVGINIATTTLDTIDADLISANIITGKTIFGVEGGATVGTPALEWSSNQGSKTWSAAVTACLDLVEDGHSDWELPNISELMIALSNSFLTGGSTLPGGFIEGSYYWSSTELDSDNAWGGYGEYGSINSTNDFNGYGFSVRCVR